MVSIAVLVKSQIINQIILAKINNNYSAFTTKNSAAVSSAVSQRF